MYLRGPEASRLALDDAVASYYASLDTKDEDDAAEAATALASMQQGTDLTKTPKTQPKAVGKWRPYFPDKTEYRLQPKDPPRGTKGFLDKNRPENLDEAAEYMAKKKQSTFGSVPSTGKDFHQVIPKDPYVPLTDEQRKTATGALEQLPQKDDVELMDRFIKNREAAAARAAAAKALAAQLATQNKITTPKAPVQGDAPRNQPARAAKKVRSPTEDLVGLPPRKKARQELVTPSKEPATPSQQAATPSQEAGTTRSNKKKSPPKKAPSSKKKSPPKKAPESPAAKNKATMKKAPSQKAAKSPGTPSVGTPRKSKAKSPPPKKLKMAGSPKKAPKSPPESPPGTPSGDDGEKGPLEKHQEWYTKYQRWIKAVKEGVNSYKFSPLTRAPVDVRKGMPKHPSHVFRTLFKESKHGTWQWSSQGIPWGKKAWVKQNVSILQFLHDQRKTLSARTPRDGWTKWAAWEEGDDEIYIGDRRDMTDRELNPCQV